MSFAAIDADIKSWMSECCERTGCAKAADLFASFSLWKKSRREQPPSNTAWGIRMERFGIKKRKSGGIIYEGIQLNYIELEKLQIKPLKTQEEKELFAVAMAEASYQAVKRAALEWQP